MQVSLEGQKYTRIRCRQQHYYSGRQHPLNCTLCKAEISQYVNYISKKINASGQAGKKPKKTQLFHHYPHTGRHTLLSNTNRARSTAYPEGAVLTRQPLLALAPLASSRRPKAEEEWPGSSDIQDIPGPVQGQCQPAQRRSSSGAPGRLSLQPLPTRLLSPTLAPGPISSPSPSAAGVTPHPRIGWGQEGSTEPTVHWAPRLFKYSLKGKGGSLWGHPIGVWAKVELPGPQPLLVLQTVSPGDKLKSQLLESVTVTSFGKRIFAVPKLREGHPRLSDPDPMTDSPVRGGKSGRTHSADSHGGGRGQRGASIG